MFLLLLVLTSFSASGGPHAVFLSAGADNAAAGAPAVAGALPAARTPPVVDVHAWMLAVAVNENAELAPLLLLSFLLWMGLPAAALRSTVCIFPTLGSRPWFPPLVPGPGSHLWFTSWFPSLGPALVPGPSSHLWVPALVPTLGSPLWFLPLVSPLVSGLVLCLVPFFILAYSIMMQQN